MLNGLATILSSRLAESQHAPPASKFCAAQSQERFDENHGTATKSVRRGHEKQARAGGTEPGTARFRDGRTEEAQEAQSMLNPGKVRGGLVNLGDGLAGLAQRLLCGPLLS